MALAVAGAALLTGGVAAGPREPSRPNVVLFLADNLGNGDLGCFGSRLHRTPNIDRLASEGARLTSFYVASGVCTPSRAALMTGCYPRRVGLHLSDRGGAVLQPVATRGLNPEETTLAEVLSGAGYATGIFGKWHLGDQPSFLPTRQGFDEFFGIPYSDDMTRDKAPDRWPDLPLMRGERVIEAPPDRDLLVRRCTDAAVDFLQRRRSRPFFLYVPFTSPGSTPRPFAAPEFQGRSRNGSYGDSVEELDWSTGRILDELRRLGLERRTLVIWTSDNGAVQRTPPQGSNLPYRGWGYDTSEGAMRMPCVVRWPGRIPAGRTCDEVCTAMDLVPTLAALAGATPPRRPIDGHDVSPLFDGRTGATSPWDEPGFGYYRMDQLQAVRSGPWKLYLPLEAKLAALNRRTAPSKLELYDVRTDLHEEREVSGTHRPVVRRLLGLAERLREEIGDVGRPGRGERLPGHQAAPAPLLLPPPRSSDPPA